VEREDVPLPSELPILKNKAETFRKGRIFVLPLEGFYLYKVFIMYGKKLDVNQSLFFKWYCVQYDSELGTANF
jgi:hypothetical protein